MDRISALPSEITEQILECLPLKEAVQTCILSKHWRHKWLSLPKLILDSPFFHNFPHNKCMTVVNHILARHVAPIHTFFVELPFGSYKFPEGADTSPWIQFLSGKLVKQLTLIGGLCYLCTVKNTVSSIFSSGGFNHLTHLTVSRLAVLSLIPTMCDGFPFLISLKLDTRFINTTRSNTSRHDSDGFLAKFLGTLVSRCPRLETLHLNILGEESNLRIHAPRLQNMTIRGQILSLCLEETKDIKVLHLEASWGDKLHTFMEFFTFLPRLERLRLSTYLLSDSKYLIEFGPPLLIIPSCVLTQLKYLELDAISTHRYQLPLIIPLLKMAPQLQELVISFLEGDGPFPENFITKEVGCLQNLKFAALHSYGIRIALPLIKSILSSAPVLELMTIVTQSLSTEEKVNMSKHLSLHPPASPNAEIIFKNAIVVQDE